MAAAVDDEALRMPCFRGGSGKWAYCTGGPTQTSGSPTTLSSCPGESVELVVLVRIVLVTSEGCAGRALPGFVPARFREASTCDACGGTAAVEGAFRSCAADHDGRNRRLRGVVEPVMAMVPRAVISSPFDDGPADVKPGGGATCDLLLSVDEVPPLPLRFRRLYFSISSASRSRIRLTMNEACVGVGGFSNRDCGGPGEGSENVPLLLAEDALSSRCCGGRDCDVEDDIDDRLVPKAGPSPVLSKSPLSVVVVVPEPLRIRTEAVQVTLSFIGTGGGRSKSDMPSPHSCPRAAA